MFGHNKFYHNTIRRSIIIFGNMFNDIWIDRQDAEGGQEKLFRVPLQYGPKDPAWVRTDADPDITRPTSLVLPRMSFQDESLGYANDRKINSTRPYIRKDSTDLNKVKFQYAPVPYDVFFSLSIYSNEIEDGLKIMEQIVPFFSPSYTITSEMIPEMNIDKDIVVTLDSVSKEYQSVGEMKQRRAIIWTLNFNMTLDFFGPIVEKPIIKLANVNFVVGDGNTAVANTSENLLQRVVITPGLDANGAATSNSAASIPSANIAIDDPFGYIITREEANSSGG